MEVLPLTLQVEWDMSVHSSIKVTLPGHMLPRQEYPCDSRFLLYSILMQTVQTLSVDLCAH